MPNLNPAVLVWARETAGLSLDLAAKQLGIKSQKTTGAELLLRYENGEKEISRPLLLKMANLYRRPLLIFYLPQPPVVADRGVDFRSVRDELKIESRGNLDALVRDLFTRQSLIKEALTDLDEAKPLDYVGSINPDQTTAEEAAEYISQLLDFEIAKYRRNRRPEDAFSYLRNLVESKGCFVFLIGNLGTHHTNIPVEAFRGFAIADQIAPLIVVNDQDSVQARNFTIIHELAHVLAGATGVSGSNFSNDTEKWCNDIASAVLFPDSEELKSQDFQLENFERLTAQINNYAQYRNLSATHVAYRLYIQGRISLETWERLATQYRDLWLRYRQTQREERDGSSGPDYYVVKKHKVGSAAVSLVQRTMSEGMLTATKAATLLGVKAGSVYKMVGV
ncbi:ImmA/IrrE family metallo-endopeptidase [Pseudomonas oryzihabitans]|uniref:ImmA/IrrE family metallo-endopeptidase n=1 Tax=Pseudomonas oryzihabitans TaxID=47885 RepID=UPI0011223AA7|nr:XRE family transcriptional regulator [Pseudomonas psychrotolerans]QDD91529.1 hypothetical protein CCZ28_21975 [Pseudomonas psychrotolerans]